MVVGGEHLNHWGVGLTIEHAMKDISYIVTSKMVVFPTEADHCNEYSP